MTSSALDAVPGLGPTRRKRLLKELGGIRAVRAADYADLAALRWLPDAVARAVYQRLHGLPPPAAATDDPTGGPGVLAPVGVDAGGVPSDAGDWQS